jgi:formylglycine-generating enzyme
MPANTADNADIRQYLTSAYSDEELTTLCADYFRDVYDNFTTGMTKAAKIQLVLDYCQRRELMPNLLAALERDRPEQYRKRFGQVLAEPGPVAAPQARDPRQIFISHAHEDADFAHRLAADLSVRGWRVWIAPESILPGEKWVAAIERGLATSGVFVVALTPAAIRSRWVRTETNAAIALEHREAVRLTPLDVEACDAPLLWSSYQCVSFRNTYEDGLRGLLNWLDPPKMATPSQPSAPVQKSAPVGQHGEAPAQPVRQAVPAVPKAASAAATQPTAQTLPDLLTIESPIHLELVRVPAGEFLMGSDPKVDKEASDDEQPQHRLFLPEFHIGKYPVTNEQYAAFVKLTRQAAPQHWTNGKIPAGKENHPVVYVSWQDAVAFCQWLSDALGKGVRLPTEAEWEKAARGSDGRTYPWGNDPPTKELCNFAFNVGDTTPVGQYPATSSPCGALDVAGNVWEWPGSLYRPYPYQSEDGRNSPDGEGSRVLRGGSFRNGARLVRCAYRDWNYPNYRVDNLGFRVVSPGF